MMMPIKNQSGAALIITLMVITILTVVVMEFIYTGTTDRAGVAAFRDIERAERAATAGITAAIEILAADFRDDGGNHVDSLDELWAKELPLPVDGFTLFLKITDEAGKIDLNSLLNRNSDKVDERYMALFRRLLSRLYLNENIADAVADWIDKNSDGLYESGYYYSLEHPYACKNGRMDSLYELRRVAGVNADVFAKLRPYLTVISDGFDRRININTAPENILLSLHDSITINMAGELIRQRKLAPFDSVAKIKELPSWADIYTEISPIIKVSSNSFSVMATAEVGRVRRVSEALLRGRNSTGATKIFYRFM